MPKIRGGRIEERGGLELVASLMGVDIACKLLRRLDGIVSPWKVRSSRLF